MAIRRLEVYASCAQCGRDIPFPGALVDDEGKAAVVCRVDGEGKLAVVVDASQAVEDRAGGGGGEFVGDLGAG